MFAREAKENETLSAFLQNVVLLKNDCEKGEGVDLAKRYEVRVYPTFAMVDGAGEVTDRWAGYAGVDGFIAQVEAALADRSTIAAKKTRFQAAPTLALAQSLAQHAESVFANVEAVDYYRKAMALDPSLTAGLREKVFMSMFYGLRGGDFTNEQLLAEGDAILADPAVTVHQAMQVAGVVKRVASSAEYVPFLRRSLEIVARPVDDPELTEDADFYRRQLAIDEALLIHEDRPLALRLRREAMDPGWQDDPAQLNRFAWWCLQNELNLAEAYELAVKAAGLATSDGDRANILDTAAQIAFKRGDIERAIEHQQEAVDLLPTRESLKRNLATFEAARDQAGSLVEPKTKTVFAERVTVAHGGKSATLVATGVGLRTRTIMKVDIYTIASYVCETADLAALAAGADGAASGLVTLDLPKRIQMEVRRDVGRDRLIGGLTSSIADDAARNPELQADLDRFVGLFDRDARKGDRIVFDYVPELGLVASVNGDVLGTITGTAMMRALWKVWLGEKPIDAGLKRDLVARV